MPLPLTDTRLFFRPLTGERVVLLRSLSAETWDRPAVAGSWQVRLTDVMRFYGAAHV